MEVAKATEFRLGKLPSSQAGDTPESAGLSRILPFLYLGSQHDALDRDCLQVGKTSPQGRWRFI